MKPEVLGERLKEIISFAIHFELRDPGLEGVTVTRVRVSADCQFADVRVAAFEGIKRAEQIVQTLDRAKGALRGLVAQRVRLRKVPELRFHYDDDVDSEQRISQILDGLEIPPPSENDESES